jgi:twitching motility protein PilI
MSAFTALDKLKELLPELFTAKEIIGEAYLRFQLTTDIDALLPMKAVKESLLVNAEEIAPLPNLPPAAMGIMSSRNKIFCAIDLAQLLKLPSALNSYRRYHLIVVEIDLIGESKLESELFLGIAVDRIQGMTRLKPEQITPTTTKIAKNLSPYASSCLQNDNKEIVILDLHKILTACYLKQTNN